MNKNLLLFYVLLLFKLTCNGQYLVNPSFEGTPQPNIPPPGWQICNTSTSTPDVQPGNFGVYLPPSNGNTYLGMTSRLDFTWEDVHTSLITPLSMDTCYNFKIDFAYQQDVAGYNMMPIILRVYGYNTACDKNHLLFISPAVSNTDWQTFEFMIHPDEVDITDLVLEVYYAQLPSYWGYMLMDNIRITPTPFVDLGNDTTLALCSNDSLVLDAGSGFAGYLWQDGSTGSTYNVDTTGLYWVQVFNEEGCSYTDSINVTIPEYIPMATEMYDSTIVCEGQEVVVIVTVINGIPPYSFEWSDLPDTTGIALITADTSKFYVVTITDHCGNTIQDSIKLVVMDGPDIDLGNDTLICIDGNYTLHAGPGFPQYVWQDGSGDSTLTINQAGLYWVTVTDNFGCSTTDSISISLFPPIIFDIGSDTTLCEGQQMVIHAGNSFILYEWQDNSSDSVYTVTETGLYWVTVTNSNGCTATDSIFVDFLPQPEIFLGNDTTVCAGDEFILDAGGGFISYLWQDNDTSQFYYVTQTGTYTVTVSNGCGEATDAIFVEVQPSPQPDLGADTVICSGQSLTLDPGGQYTGYLWQDNTTLPVYVVTTSGVYSVTVQNNFGCTGSDEIYISLSDPAVNLGEVTHVCEGDSLVLDAGEGFESYLWQNNSTGQTQTIDTAGTYSVIVFDQYGCEASGQIVIELFPYPVADLGDDIEICSGEQVVLEALQGIFDYYWNGIPGNQTFTITTSGNYSLTVVNPCDSVTDDIQVTVQPLPEIYLGEDRVIFPGETLELDAGSGFDQYLWQDGSGGQYFVITENNSNPLNSHYYVEVTEGICKNSDTIEVVVAQVWVPKVITLNGDGDNEIFRADSDKWKGIGRHSMIVFNRWGEKVWESDDFLTGWDGRQKGKYVADGTYFWVLEIYYGSKEIKQTLKGSLTVLGSGK